MVKFYSNYGYNHTGLYKPDIDSSSLKQSLNKRGSNLYGNLSYRQPLKNGWKAEAALAYDLNRQKNQNLLVDLNNAQLQLDDFPFNVKNYRVSTQQSFAQLRTVFTKKFGRNQALRFGGEHFYTKDRYTFDDGETTLTDNLSAAFVEANIYLARNLAAKIGLRAEHSSLLGKTNLAPRLGLAYRLNNGGQFNFAYGMFYQKPEVFYLLHNRNLDYARATHYIVNYQHKFSNRLLRVEAYYKKYGDLVTTFPDTATKGHGYARGVELFFRDKRTFKNFDYWISFTYLDTKRQYSNYPYALQPNFATPHTASIAIKRFFPDISFSANLSYSIATGRPYYNIQNNGDKALVADQGKTNGYNQMNLSFAYLFSMFRHWKHKDFSGIGCGLNNVFGTSQVYGYNYSSNGASKMPITMPATRSVYLGIFMSLGIDRRDDFINNNL